MTPTFVDLSPPPADLLGDARRGLSQSPPHLSPKFFYDARGSELFEEITRLPEYYLTRTELSILRSRAGEIAQALGPGLRVIEPGSGSGEKTQILLSALEDPAGLVLIDISDSALRESVRGLAQSWPELEITAVCADFTKPVSLPTGGPGVVFFPGSTIGNFELSDAAQLLRNLSELAGPQGRMLVGFDRIKDPSELEAAYDDAQGVTARFNLNLLARLQETGAELTPQVWAHRSTWNAHRARVEMHLVASEDTEIRIGDQRFAFAAGQSIHSESAHKYDLPRIRSLAQDAGLRLLNQWSDERERFTLALLGR